MHIFRVILGPTVKEACLVGSCPATMEVTVHLLQEVHAASAWKVMGDPSVSIAVMKAAPPSPAEMEVYALKRPASHTFTASVLVAGQVNGANKVAGSRSSRHPHVLSQTVIAKLMMVCVTRNVIHCHVTGTAVTVHWQWNLGLVVHAAGVPSITASVMTPATMLTVCMTTLTAKTRKKFASEFASNIN